MDVDLMLPLKKKKKSMRVLSTGKMKSCQALGRILIISATMNKYLLNGEGSFVIQVIPAMRRSWTKSFLRPFQDQSMN